MPMLKGNLTLEPLPVYMTSHCVYISLYIYTAYLFICCVQSTTNSFCWLMHGGWDVMHGLFGCVRWTLHSKQPRTDAILLSQEPPPRVVPHPTLMLPCPICPLAYTVTAHNLPPPPLHTPLSTPVSCASPQLLFLDKYPCCLSSLQLLSIAVLHAGVIILTLLWEQRHRSYDISNVMILKWLY